MRKLDLPQAPLVFAVVMGPMVEISFRQALTMSRGDLHIFVGSPISCSLVATACLVLLAPPLWQHLQRARGQRKASSEGNA